MWLTFIPRMFRKKLMFAPRSPIFNTKCSMRAETMSLLNSFQRCELKICEILSKFKFKKNTFYHSHNIFADENFARSEEMFCVCNRFKFAAATD